MKILVITHTFPPSPHPNAKRPYYVVKALLAAGWEVDVVTSYIGVREGDVEPLNHSKCRVSRIKDPVEQSCRKLGKTTKLARWTSMAANGLLFPDFCALWARKVFRDCHSIAKKYDRVLAFVFPPSVLLSGEYGIVAKDWIFDFQESVTPQFEKFPRSSPLQRFRSKRLRTLEQSTLSQAEKVIFTANSNRKAYVDSGLVEPGKTFHVPYFYDEAGFNGERETSSLFEIGYYGSFDQTGSRNPITFLRALAGFLQRHPEARGRTRFRFHGSWHESHDQVIDELNLRDVCHIGKGIPYLDYLQKIQQSPVLLLVVAEAHNLFMPSKIVDYFGAQRPVLAFVPAHSEMHEVLIEAGMEDYLCGDSDVQAGISALERLWIAYLGQSLRVDPSKTTKWSSSFQIARYLKILDPQSTTPPITVS